MYVCTFQPGNFTGCGSGGVKMGHHGQPHAFAIIAQYSCTCIGTHSLETLHETPGSTGAVECCHCLRHLGWWTLHCQKAVNQQEMCSMGAQCQKLAVWLSGVEFSLVRSLEWVVFNSGQKVSEIGCDGVWFRPELYWGSANPLWWCPMHLFFYCC